MEILRKVETSQNINDTSMEMSKERINGSMSDESVLFQGWGDRNLVGNL